MARDLKHAVLNPPRWVLVMAVIIGSTISVISGIGLYGASQRYGHVTDRNSQTTQQLAFQIKGLLTSGKTTTAERVRRLSDEVDTLIGNQHGNRLILNDVLYLVRYAQQAQKRSPKALSKIITAIEKHIDATIARDVARMKRQLLRVREHQ